MMNSFTVQYRAPPAVAKPFQTEGGQTVCSSYLQKNLQNLTLNSQEIFFPDCDNVTLKHRHPRLGDQVVSIDSGGVVPFGTSGVIIAIKHLDQEHENLDYFDQLMSSFDEEGEEEEVESHFLDECDSVEVEVMFEEVLLGASTLNNKISSNKGLRVNVRSLLNMSSPPDLVTLTAGEQPTLYREAEVSERRVPVDLTSSLFEALNISQDKPVEDPFPPTFAVKKRSNKKKQ
ncbi:hypothetical protein GEMRC1_004405 [Eukaryota sp. GEM-RC1]